MSMKKIFIYAGCLATLASCMETDIVDKTIVGSESKEVPISFVTNQRNITRATNLESNLHYNFGVWAQKIKDSKTQKVMENYLVGFGGTNKGYDHTNATTWAESAGTTADHTSPWFYEGLGTAEYTYSGTAGFYKATDTKYMSANANQYLRFWDLAYNFTNFYCYSPYNNETDGVKCTMNTDGTATMTFANNIIRDGYDKPLNSDYTAKDGHPAYDRSLAEFMVGGVQATNSTHQDVVIPFKHMGAQLFIRFYEDVPGYKVEIVDLSKDGGNMASTATDDQKNGIQATPAVPGATTTDPYTLSQYYTTSGATVNFSETAGPTFSAVYTGTTPAVNATQVSTNLMFKVPSITAADYETAIVPTGYGSVENTNWKKIENTQATTTNSETTHYVIPEKADGTQNYAWSPTIYYPVAQPATQTTGFTFHVTYRIIADDNKEVTTVHNATVFVPATGNAKVDGTDKTGVTIARWEANTRYIYTFKITKNSTGTTTPDTEINPVNPTPSTDKSLFPIVFDQCTVQDYSVNESDHTISNGTTY